MASLGEYIFGKESKVKSRSLQTPLQQEIFGKLLGGVGGLNPMLLQILQQYLQPGQQGIDEFSQPYMQQFESQILPRIAERFAGGAQGGALSSSGFAQALGGAGADLQSQLAQLYSGRQQQTSGQLLNSLQGLSTAPTFGFSQRPASQGLFSTIMGSFAQGLGQSANPFSGIGG